MVSRAPLKKALLTADHIERRKEWAERNKDRDWSKVLFTDESTFHTYQTPRRVWRMKGTKVYRKTWKHPGKVHVWGCFSVHGFGKIHPFTGNLNAIRLIHIYQTSLLPSIAAMEEHVSDVVLQEDNDSKHKSKLANQL